MKPSSQGCRIGNQYQLIDVTTMGSNGKEFIKKPLTQIETQLLNIFIGVQKIKNGNKLQR